ncbi:cyanamide hydratase [Leifsonia sp. LS-T14]|uniref:cyanamide hydratase n=1 Tax=unclassified Leifsonia TaxID=2663824 RepID=UPI0035A72E7F
MRIADYSRPDTAAARAAEEIAADYHSPSLLNHVQRSWLWAEGFAALRGFEPDHELLFVSALLHDLGITPEFDNHTLAYEDAAGHVAIALTAGAGWPAGRRVRAHEVIVRHNWPEVDPAMDVEGHLLEIATALDISGARADDLPLEFRREVLTAYPRLDLAAEFGGCVADQAERKPTTSARRLVDGGVQRKLRDNPLERILEG